MILTNRFSFVVAAFFVRRQELLKHARLEEYHEIEDPEEVGLDVHQQLTELFYEKYLGTSPDAQGETAEPVEDQAEEYDDDGEEGGP